MTKKYNVSVQTLIYHRDGRLFADLGTMCWPRVNDEVVQWLAGSCKTTAFWLIGLPKALGDDTYTLKYRTIVTTEDGKPVSDTTPVEFEDLSYDDVVRFEHWALNELNELLKLFVRQRVRMQTPTVKRSKVAAVMGLAWQVLRNKLFRNNR